jgi:anthranilate phosphoribosyltransferase
VTLIDQLGTHAVRWTPADFGLSATTLEPLLVDGPAASAALIMEVLRGTHGTPRNIVVMNSAAAMWVAGQVSTLSAGTAAAREAIDSGQARHLLAQLAAMSRRS